MLQFFGILTALDCTDDLWAIGMIGLISGVVIGFIARHLCAYKLPT